MKYKIGQKLEDDIFAPSLVIDIWTKQRDRFGPHECFVICEWKWGVYATQPVVHPLTPFGDVEIEISRDASIFANNLGKLEEMLKFGGFDISKESVNIYRRAERHVCDLIEEDEHVAVDNWGNVSCGRGHLGFVFIDWDNNIHYLPDAPWQTEYLLTDGGIFEEGPCSNLTCGNRVASTGGYALCSRCEVDFKK